MITWIHKRLEGREEGFTLIELLVVVVIIGILAAIAIPAFLNQRERAWRSSVQSDLRNAAVEMETEATADNGDYPATLPAIQTTDDVTVLLSSTSNATQFCLTGSHTNVNSDAISYVFDSDAGGIREDTDCTP